MNNSPVECVVSTHLFGKSAQFALVCSVYASFLG